MQTQAHNLIVVQPVVLKLKHADTKTLPQSNAFLLRISCKNSKIILQQLKLRNKVIFTTYLMFNSGTTNTTYVLQQFRNLTISHIFVLFWFYLDSKNHGCGSYLGHTLHLDNYNTYGFCPSEPQILLLRNQTYTYLMQGCQTIFIG